MRLKVNTYTQKLHWLPVRQRIHFKILLINYKSINDMVPEYLSELVSIRKSFRKLRSSSQILLQVPVSRLKSYGDCVFSVTAPTLWNRLLANIRNVSSLENFKSLLKTHLFKVAFTDKSLLSFKSLQGSYKHYLGYC